MLPSSGVRLALAVMAAFSTSAKGGFIPQARHGGNGNDSVAMVGSKLEGTGFENEQIGQTHVPTTTDRFAEDRGPGRKGLEDRDVGEDEEAIL